ncbi:peptidase M24 [Halobiforma lacisalsi AJ5]|uniref:Peptidase M24 n=1 Tax=Natronobacterium lacisalsi AJ5 TaxID=358396 RepID=A0A1P8LNY4_NATLA|nr:M24 family metallopeptidase [Halobiforma lacisalsi]APW97487.1 peptidase M24 [Halobiforma lacisalsi AJ5]
MTDGTPRADADSRRTPPSRENDVGADALESILDDRLESRNAAAFVHAGTDRDPGVRYSVAALASIEDDDHDHDHDHDPARGRSTYAIGYDGEEWHLESERPSAPSDRHPAARLADALAAVVDPNVNVGPAEPTVLTPASIPHDAALYLEQRGFGLASTDALERARAKKTDAERARIERAQRAARAGLHRGAELLAATTVEDDRLVLEGEDESPEPLTDDRLRTAVDEGITAAGGFPVGNTTISVPGDGRLRPGEPIVVAVAPRDPDGYYGALARTVVVDSDGGRERRTHVALTQAFGSTRAMLTAGPETVAAVEGDLEAEIRAFGEDGAVETRATGVGLEPAERPLAPGTEIEPGAVVRIDAAVEVGDGRCEDKPDPAEWLAAPSRSLEPTALLESPEREF